MMRYTGFECYHNKSNRRSSGVSRDRERSSILLQDASEIAAGCIQSLVECYRTS